MRRLADRWISLFKVEKTYKGLLGLMLSEQLLQSVSHDLATFLCEKDERSFQNLIKSAESYRHAHPNKILARMSEATVFGSVGSVRDEHRPSEHFCSTNSFRGYGGYQSGQSGPSRFWNRRGFDSTRRSAPKCCYLCKQPGHFHHACPWKSRKNPCRVCTFSHSPDQCPFYQVATKESTACALAPPSVRPEVACSLQESFSGKLHLQSGTVNGVRCSVLRDTGATVCGVRERLVRPCQLLGSSIRCVSFGGREEFPLAKVSVESPYFSGEMTCCVLDAPVADFSVGNVPQVPSLVSQDESCSFAAVTRARSKLVVDKKPLSQIIQDFEVTPDVLSDMQRQDESLRSSFQAAEKGEVRSAGDTSSYFYLSEGILYQSFTKGSLSVFQVVVPKGLRSTLLAVSHDAILAGHPGSRRTLTRVRSSFFWPGVTVDVLQYVKSCDVCQKTTPKLAMQNSSAVSQRNKKYYDKKTQDRRFSVGEEVLVLLPSASNMLLSSWLGPFPITKVFHPDYRVLVKGKEKVFHANMLKRYVRRGEAADVAVGGSKCVQSVGDFVPWSEISPLLDEVDMSVPKVPSISSGDFRAVESVRLAGVVQDHGEDVSVPTLSVPMSTSIPDEDVSCVQFDAALSEVQLGELKAVFQAHADV